MAQEEAGAGHSPEDLSQLVFPPLQMADEADEAAAVVGWEDKRCWVSRDPTQFAFNSNPINEPSKSSGSVDLVFQGKLGKHIAGKSLSRPWGLMGSEVGLLPHPMECLGRGAV